MPIIIGLVLLASEATFKMSVEHAGAILVGVAFGCFGYAMVSAMAGCTNASAAFGIAGFLTLVLGFGRGDHALEGAVTRWMWNLPAGGAIGVAWWLFNQCYRVGG